MLALALGLLVSAPAMAEDEDPGGGATELELRAEATLGASLYWIDHPQDNDDIGGFWDQYRHTRQKDDDPAWFFDLFHTDVGLARDDDTFLLRIESWSPHPTNDRVELDGLYHGLDLDVDFWRYRSEELRVFPEGTGGPDSAFAFGSQYTPDATDDEILGRNRRFWKRRTGAAGELRFRPDGFGWDVPVLAELSVRSGYEEREGRRQDRFVLDTNEVPLAGGGNQRFRGNRREIDQKVQNVGSALVLAPGGGWVADLDFAFETFRERADPVLLPELGVTDFFGSPFPAAGDPVGLRPFNFIPDSDRISGTLRVAGPLGPVAIEASAFLTHLEQTNRSPLQRSLGLDQQQFTTWSAHGSFQAPLGESLELSGFAKFSERRNGLDANDFESGRYIAPILRRRSELEAWTELGFRPQAGALVAAGYRFAWIDRNLRYAQPPGAIPRELAFIEDDSLRHTVYLRARARLLRSLQLRGEIGFGYAPERDFPRDPTSTLYFDGRGSYTLPRPVPMTLTVFGGVRDGRGNGRVLQGTGSQARKDVDRLTWNHGTTLTALPFEDTVVTLSFVRQNLRQELPYQRTDELRTTSPPPVLLQPTEEPHYRSDVKSLGATVTQRVWDTVELRAYTNWSWVQAWYSDPSATSSAFEGAHEIRNRILTVGWGIGWDAVPGLRLDVGHRYDDFRDDRERNALFSQDDRRHTLTLAATMDLELLETALGAGDE